MATTFITSFNVHAPKNTTPRSLAASSAPTLRPPLGKRSSFKTQLHHRHANTPSTHFQVTASVIPAFSSDHKALYQRVVPAVLPKLYVYDHCPFCVRVRMALGVKNIKHEVVFMANDDVKTPTEMIGKKIAPIIELPDGTIMGESMDIVRLFDGDARYGPTNVIAEASGRKDIKAWQKKVKDLLRLLHRPRYMLAALPEFQQHDSRDFFVKGHPVPPYDKPEWKADGFPMEKKWHAYEKAYAQTPELLPQINAALLELDDMIASPQGVNPTGGVSIDDIDLWARLRSVTIIDGVQMPPKMRAYMNYFADVGDCPLYFNMKC